MRSWRSCLFNLWFDYKNTNNTWMIITPYKITRIIFCFSFFFWPLSVLPFTAFDYPFGIFKLLNCISGVMVSVCAVIGIDSLMVCILFGEISIFHSRVMGFYSSNCRRFFVCRAANWEPLGQFTSNFAQLLELIVLRSVYFLVKFRVIQNNLNIHSSWKQLSTGTNCQTKSCVQIP
jgi:hypothetical protein